jgi:hypothetical protein
MTPTLSMARVTMAQLARELQLSKNTAALALRYDPQISPAHVNGY